MECQKGGISFCQLPHHEITSPHYCDDDDDDDDDDEKNEEEKCAEDELLE